MIDISTAARPAPSTQAGLPHPTAIDLPGTTRAELIDLLNRQLANVSDLFSQTKQAHWNIRGPEFYQLHLLFDDLARPLSEHVDTLAERAVSLGGLALGSVRAAAECSELDDFPRHAGAMEYVQELAKRYGAACNSARTAVAQSDQLGDANTADILTALSRTLDRSLYFLEAHIRP